MMPTASEPPVTKLRERHARPRRRACIACSGSAARSPAVRISRVVATFSTSRKSVTASSSDGKTANSSGLFT